MGVQVRQLPGGAMTYPPEGRRDLACFSDGRRWEAEEGSPSPLGVSYVEQDDQFNFALYSKHAASVDLLLFAVGDCVSPLHVVKLIWPRHKSGRIWHCRLPAALARRAAYYAYRIDGPRDPGNGHRFDPDKILLDPYARAIHFPPGFSRSAACRSGSNSGKAALGVLTMPAAPSVPVSRPIRHTHDAIIYELHVK